MNNNIDQNSIETLEILQQEIAKIKAANRQDMLAIVCTIQMVVEKMIKQAPLTREHEIL